MGHGHHIKITITIIQVWGCQGMPQPQWKWRDDNPPIWALSHVLTMANADMCCALNDLERICEPFRGPIGPMRVCLKIGCPNIWGIYRYFQHEVTQYAILGCFSSISVILPIIPYEIATLYFEGIDAAYSCTKQCNFSSYLRSSGSTL